jgi:D-amino-acid dehydrogenase
MTGGGGSGKRVLVVGGGVIGLSCAYYLARRGATVTVLERQAIGAGASSGNAGTIAPGHGPINRPGRVRQALRSLADPLSPLYVAPRWDPALARWLLSFSRHSTAARWRAALAALAPLGLATPGLFDELVRQERLDCDYRPCGYYEVCLTDAGLRAAEHEAGAQRLHGFRAERLDAEALREREPALRPEVRGGVFFPQAATLDPRRFLEQLADRAQRRGVVVRTGIEVVGLAIERSRVVGVRTAGTDTLPAEAVVLATGAYSASLLTRLGYRLPIQPAKGYHVDRDPRPGTTPPLGIACVLSETSVFCTPMSGWVRFAGTLEFSGLNQQIRRPRLEQLTRAASRYFAGLGPQEPRSEWCGLRPCLPDGLPVIGAAPRHPGLFVATGHAMMGLTLGPVTGQLVAQLVLDGRTDLDLGAFRLDRF